MHDNSCSKKERLMELLEESPPSCECQEPDDEEEIGTISLDEEQIGPSSCECQEPDDEE